jgi:hypothetical protein
MSCRNFISSFLIALPATTDIIIIYGKKLERLVYFFLTRCNYVAESTYQQGSNPTGPTTTK